MMVMYELISFDRYITTVEEKTFICTHDTVILKNSFDFAVKTIQQRPFPVVSFCCFVCFVLLFCMPPQKKEKLVLETSFYRQSIFAGPSTAFDHNRIVRR